MNRGERIGDVDESLRCMSGGCKMVVFALASIVE